MSRLEHRKVENSGGICDWRLHNHRFGNEMTTDLAMIEARARIIWGEPSSDVHGFLISNGFSGELADAKLREFEVERNRELRRIGVRNVVIGSVLTGAAAVALGLGLSAFSATSGSVRALAIVLLGGIFGLLKLVKGIVYLCRPESEHRSIPDIEQSDVME